MEAVGIGYATNMGVKGADYWLYLFNELPDYYITKEEAHELGWVKYLGNLHNIAPWKMIGGIMYKNKNKHLPEAPGRIWYEADINYRYGWRNSQRILYSNDGLMFATYNHYMSFVEIVREVV